MWRQTNMLNQRIKCAQMLQFMIRIYIYNAGTDTEWVWWKFNLNVQLLVPLPSSELDPLGRPFGWYFICTLRLIPEKCPYLRQMTNDKLIEKSSTAIVSASASTTHISKTLFSCSNFPCFSSIDGSADFVWISDNKYLAMSNISCSCFGRFNFTWPCL